MTNFGKIAYNKLVDLNREKMVENYGFNGNVFSLINQNSFKINIQTNNENLFFKLDLNSNSNLKVYVNSKLEFYENNCLKTGFKLFISNNAEINFVFENAENLECNLTVLGNYALLNMPEVEVKVLNDEINVIKQSENNFTIFSGNNCETVLNNYNQNGGTEFEGQFVDIEKIDNEKFVFYNFDNITNLKTENNLIVLQKKLQKNSIIINSQINTANFVCLNVINNQINISLICKDGTILDENYYLSPKINGNIIKLIKINNRYNNSLNFGLIDSNLNTYIVLCNFNDTLNIFEILGLQNLGMATYLNLMQTTSNDFEIALKNKNEIKHKKFTFTSNPKTFCFNFCETFNNVSKIHLINSTEKIFNFNNNLILN